MSNSRIVDGSGFKIGFTDEAGYLRAHVFDGTGSQAVSVAMWTMLGAECAATGNRHLLVLEELQASVDIAEIEPVIEAMVEAGFAGVRIAFVEMLDDIEGSEYGEILCREQCITIRTFSNEHSARRWLLYGVEEAAS